MPLEDLLTGFGGQTWPWPSIAGQYKGGRLVICADAACVWEDLEKFGCKSTAGRGAVRKGDWHFMTVNRLVETFPGNIEHAYSNEAVLQNTFIAARRQEYKREFNGPAHTHSCNKGAMHRWPWPGRGSSGLGAAIVACALGYSEIVLAGMPLDDGPHNGEPPWRRCEFILECREGSHWDRAIKAALKGRVTSLSGRTQRWLGSPNSSTSTARIISSGARARPTSPATPPSS